MTIDIKSTFLVRYASIRAVRELGEEVDLRVYPDGMVYYFAPLERDSPPVMLIADDTKFDDAELEVIRALGVAMLEAYG